MNSLHKFPYADAGEVIYFQDMTGQNFKINQKQEVQLYRRFPWLQFKNEQLKKKYIYMGRQTEKSHPFYIRFNLSEESEDGIHHLSSLINERMKVVVEAIVNPSVAKTDSKLKKTVQEMYNTISSDMTLFSTNSFSVHHGYLLTGIAKPNIRYNQIYDSLFLEVLRSKEVIREESNDRKGVYNMMKLSWDYKYHSYEYFMFMSRAYAIIQNKLKEQKVLQEQIDDLTSMELFNFNEARVIKYWDNNGKHKEIRNMDYFQYFSALFKQYNQAILHLKPNTQEYPRRYILMLGQKEHHLYEFNFRSYLQQQFKGKQLPNESLQRMVNHNHQRSNQILHNFPVKTRKQRISRLRKVINNDKQIYHRIKLLPLAQTQFNNNYTIQQDQNFLILFMREEQANVANTCCLKDVIDKMITIEEETVRKYTYSMENLKIQRESLFYNLYREEQWGKKYQLLQHFSFDPNKLTYEEDGIVSPTFEHAVISLLELDKLPLTLEQQLLTCTPTAQINTYEQLQKIVKEYQASLKDKKTLEQFCLNLSDEKEDGIMFQYLQSEQQVNIDDNDSGEEETRANDKGVRLKILQMSMIDFQSNRTRCFYCSNGEPYNAFTPTHYKELQQYLVILLIQTDIINNVQCTKNGKKIQFQGSSVNNNMDRVGVVKQNYFKNWDKYKKYKAYNQKRSYFRQVDQNIFRAVIRSLFQDFQNKPILYKCLREMMKVVLKSFIAIEFLETRLVIRKIKDDDNEEQSYKLLISEYLESLEQFRKMVEAISKQEKSSNRSDLSDPKWKAMDQTYYKELKNAISGIQKEFASCKQMLKMGPLKSDEVKKAISKQDTVSLERKITSIKQNNLIVFCGVYSDLLKLQDQEFDNMILLYKVLLCFCCHLNQFHKNELLRYQVNKILTIEGITPKIYKFKNVMLTELVNFICSYKDRYLA